MMFERLDQGIAYRADKRNIPFAELIEMRRRGKGIPEPMTPEQQAQADAANAQNAIDKEDHDAREKERYDREKRMHDANPDDNPTPKSVVPYKSATQQRRWNSTTPRSPQGHPPFGGVLPGVLPPWTQTFGRGAEPPVPPQTATTLGQNRQQALLQAMQLIPGGPAYGSYNTGKEFSSETNYNIAKVPGIDKGVAGRMSSISPGIFASGGLSPTAIREGATINQTVAGNPAPSANTNPSGVSIPREKRLGYATARPSSIRPQGPSTRLFGDRRI